ncbi:hypothetical protein F4860DRAFT_498870 [Xylaria cubensis]|nr:hypothetical protein F4860DRAFT_498870 [Xylaria cubensis]
MASSPSHVSTPKKESLNDSSEPCLWSSPPQGSPPSPPPSSSPPLIPSSEPKPSSSAQPFLSGSILPDPFLSTHIASEPTLPGPPPSAPTDDNSEVQQAYKAIADLFHNRYGPVSSDPSFRLNKKSFLELRQQLEDHNLLEYFDENLRYEWIIDTLTLRILPKTSIHSIMAGDLAKAINGELDRLAVTYPALLSYRQELYNAYTGRIPCVGYLSPDGQFRYGPNGEQVPFLIEVSYAQHLNDLRRKVQQYFGYLRDVQTILCIDITAPQPIERRYQPGYTHAARAILWTIRRIPGRQNKIDTILDTQFCWTDGRISPGALFIPFKHFLPLQHRDGSPDQDQAVSILYTGLVQMLQRGESVDRTEMQRAEPVYEPCAFD